MYERLGSHVRTLIVLNMCIRSDIAPHSMLTDRVALARRSQLRIFPLDLDITHHLTQRNIDLPRDFLYTIVNSTTDFLTANTTFRSFTTTTLPLRLPQQHPSRSRRRQA